MKITEFFKSIEGEGIRTGRICTFVRTFGCPCRCVYCDSMYSNETGHGVEIQTMSIGEIVKQCIEFETPYITLTGGEPLIQKDVENLIASLLLEGFEVNVETSGAVDIKPIRDKVYALCPNVPKEKLIFTIDYKSISSGSNEQMISRNFTRNLLDWDVVKFVVGTKEDLEDMKRMVSIIKDSYTFVPPIFVSPIFGMIEPKDIVEYIKENDLFDVRMQLQIHKYIWNFDERGV